MRNRNPVVDTHQALLRAYENRAIRLGFSDVKIVEERTGHAVRGEVLARDDFNVVQFFSDPIGRVTLVATSEAEDVVILIDEFGDTVAVAMAASSLGELVAAGAALSWPDGLDATEDEVEL